MIAEEPIITLRPIDVLKNTKPENGLRNKSNAHVDTVKTLEEESCYYSLKHNVKLRYELLMKSKAPICLLISFYIFFYSFSGASSLVINNIF